MNRHVACAAAVNRSWGGGAQSTRPRRTHSWPAAPTRVFSRPRDRHYEPERLPSSNSSLSTRVWRVSPYCPRPLARGSLPLALSLSLSLSPHVRRWLLDRPIGAAHCIRSGGPGTAGSRGMEVSRGHNLFWLHKGLLLLLRFAPRSCDDRDTPHCRNRSHRRRRGRALPRRAR